MGVQAFGENALIAHPDTPARAVSNVFFTFVQAADGWAVDFHVQAPLAALKLPPTLRPARANGLWEHTCFEMFVLDPVSGSYLEFNFSPSGQWAAYQFDGYRAGMRELGVPAPRIVIHDPVPGPQHVWLRAELDDTRPRRGVARVGLSAVIEEADGTKSYWALAHPPGKPDFHHADCFALTLPAP